MTEDLGAAIALIPPLINGWGCAQLLGRAVLESGMVWGQHQELAVCSGSLGCASSVLPSSQEVFRVSCKVSRSKPVAAARECFPQTALEMRLPSSRF